MAYQQKLFHVHYASGVGAADAVVITTNLRLVILSSAASLQVAPDVITHEFRGGDPSATSRVWYTAPTTAGFTANWAGVTAGIDIRFTAGKRHSICYDLSITQSPY